MDKMQLGIFVATMIDLSSAAVFSRGERQREPPSIERRTAMLAKFFDMFWGWADYRPKDWSKAPYKRGYGPKATA